MLAVAWNARVLRMALSGFAVAASPIAMRAGAIDDTAQGASDRALPDETADVIASADAVGSFLMRPHPLSQYIVWGDASHVGEVRGYAVREWGPALSEAQVLVLREVLLEPKNYDLEPRRCEFSPNIGFAFTSMARTVTALV
ncbi:MAG: hypothetical protein ACRDGR_06850, partial [bacterium]